MSRRTGTCRFQRVIERKFLLHQKKKDRGNPFPCTSVQWAHSKLKPQKRWLALCLSSSDTRGLMRTYHADRQCHEYHPRRQIRKLQGMNLFLLVYHRASRSRVRQRTNKHHPSSKDEGVIPVTPKVPYTQAQADGLPNRENHAGGNGRSHLTKCRLLEAGWTIGSATATYRCELVDARNAYSLC